MVQRKVEELFEKEATMKARVSEIIKYGLIVVTIIYSWAKLEGDVHALRMVRDRDWTEIQSTLQGLQKQVEKSNSDLNQQIKELNQNIIKLYEKDHEALHDLQNSQKPGVQ